MKTVKAREHFDEAVTEQGLEKAVIRGGQRPRQNLHATAVEYLEDHRALFIIFADHTGIALPVANYPELANLSRTELASLKIGFGGSALCLDSRDLHVLIAGLVSASQPLVELASTVVAASNGRRSSIARDDPSAQVRQALSALKKSLCTTIDVGGLIARSSIAHKWKAPWRALLLREAVAWRIQDLLQQSTMLFEHKRVLGARILLRSAFETLAILIYLNQSIRSVVAGKTDFHAFSKTTTKLLLGSRDKSTSFDSINILTILRKADVRYPGIEGLYRSLSESAHPNHEGMVLGYSKNDSENYVTSFMNRWGELYAESQAGTLMLCLGTFEHEYNDEFPSVFEALEQWIIANDATLESTKPNEVER